MPDHVRFIQKDGQSVDIAIVRRCFFETALGTEVGPDKACNSIGTPDAINQVKGTIVCGPANLPNPLFVADTPLVSLSSHQGDAEFEGNVGPFPSAWTPSNVAFLVRIAAGRWIANGAVRSSP